MLFKHISKIKKIMYYNKKIKSKVILFFVILLSLIGVSFAGYNCDTFNQWKWLYVGLNINDNNLVGGDCSSILNYYKDSDTNGIHYSWFIDDINQQSFVTYNTVKSLTGDFFNIYDYKSSVEFGGNWFASLLWFNKWLTYWTKDLFIWPNIQYIFPFKPIYTNMKYVPVIIYAIDAQLPLDTPLKANIYVTNKDLADKEDNISLLAKSKLLNVSIWNGRYSVFWLNIDELRGNNDEGSLFVYTVVKNIYGNKSTIIKTKIDYNRVKLKTVLWYTPDYVKYDNKEWTKHQNVNFLYAYSNLKPKTVESNNKIKVSLSNIVAWTYNINGKTYKYRAKLYLYDLKQWANNVDVKISDIYGNINPSNKIIVNVDNQWPQIVKANITKDYSINYNGKIYLDPKAYTKNNWFDMILNVKDAATKTVKVIVKTDMWKKILIDMKDWNDYLLKKLKTSFDKDWEKMLEIEAYDVLWNVSKKVVYYNTLNISYPVITYPPKDNLIVINNSLDFKWLCSGASQASIQFQLNNNKESDWISYKDSWDVNQLLNKWYNLFKVRCKNIVGSSDYVERVVIYEPKENVWWRNQELEMYPSESNKFIMNRSNKNADNDTLKVSDPTLNKNIPWFSNIDK